MKISWRGNTLEELVPEYQGYLGEIKSNLFQKLEQAQAQNNPERKAALRDALQKNVEILTDSYQNRLDRLGLAESALPYDNKLSLIDLGLIVYDGDRDYLLEFARDPNVRAAYEVLKENNPVMKTRKKLLQSSLRLTPKFAPKFFEVVEKCKKAVALTQDLELYVYQGEEFNAACYPPDDKRIYIILSSGLLEKFTEDELSFVIGHEIGHAIFGHHRYPAEAIMELGGDSLSPLHAMKLFAWKRNAEVTADRVGLLCCRNLEASVKSFFKLSSGVTSSVLQFNLEEYLGQFAELEAEMADKEMDPEDWFQSHPFSPIRIKALELFSRSETYQTLIGETGGDITEEDMEARIGKFMAIMEPSYFEEESEAAKLAQKFLFLSGYLVAIADEVLEESELAALGRIVKPKIFNKCMGEVEGKSPEKIRDRVMAIAAKLNQLLSPLQKLDLIQQLALISNADGKIVDEELYEIRILSLILDINPDFAEQVIHDMAEEMD